MPRQTEWTVSGTRLKSLQLTANRLKEALDRKKVDPDRVDSLVREVMVAANRVARSSALEPARGKRYVVPLQQFHDLPGQINNMLTRWEREREQMRRSPETAAVLQYLAKNTGQAVFALVKAALDSPGLKDYRLR